MATTIHQPPKDLNGSAQAIFDLMAAASGSSTRRRSRYARRRQLAGVPNRHLGRTRGHYDDLRGFHQRDDYPPGIVGDWQHFTLPQCSISNTACVAG